MKFCVFSLIISFKKLLPRSSNGAFILKMIYENKIIHANCYDIIPTLPDKSIDFVLTDPPYQFLGKTTKGCGFYKKEGKKHLEKIEKSFGLNFKPRPFLQMIRPKMKRFNACIWTNKNRLIDYLEFAEENQYKWEIIIWHKPNPIPAHYNHLMLDKEYCIYIHESGTSFNNQLAYKNYFSVFNYPIGKKESKHPTEKPVVLFDWLLQLFSQENDVVLDCFSGSGTTALACHTLKRRFLCIEKDFSYWKESINRLEEHKNTLF